MGWDQVTLTHAHQFWKSGHSVRKRLGLYYIFVFRWFMQTMALFVTIFNSYTAIESFLTHQPIASSSAGPLVRLVQRGSFALYLTFIISTLFRASFYKSASLVPFIICYFAILPLYVIFGGVLIAVSLYRITTGNIGGWVVTSRVSTTKPLQRPLVDTE